MREEISSRAKTSLYQAVNMLISGVNKGAYLDGLIFGANLRRLFQ